MVINNPTSTAVTIPGFGGAVTTCMSYRGKLIPETLRALASGALLSCSGKKVCKEAGLRGEQLAPARIVPPLRIPRVEPTGIDPSLWLGVVGFSPYPRLGSWFLGCFVPTLSIESLKKPDIAQWNDTGRKKAPLSKGAGAGGD